MGIWTDIREFFAGKSGGFDQREQGQAGYAWSFPTTSSTGLVGRDSALNIVAVYACVRVLAETVASLPLLLYRRNDGGKERYSDNEWYETLHDRPNPEMTSFVWRETMMSHLTTWGNAYNEIAYDRMGRPQLWPIRPDRIEALYDERGVKVFDYLSPMGGRRRLKPGTVFHIPGLSSNGLRGLSPITLHREALGLYQAAQNFGTSFFRNNARPAVVLSHPRNLTPAAIERLSAQMESLKGSDNAGKTVILEEGLELHEIGIPPEDAQYIETRKFQMQEVARMFRVPPHMVGDLERATFSNIEHQSIDFVVHTIRPWLVRIEQEINTQLLTEDGVYAEFLVDGLLRGDAESRAKALQTLRQNGVISADDWRAIENLNPIGGTAGAAYWQPMNYHALLPNETTAELEVNADPALKNGHTPEEIQP